MTKKRLKYFLILSLMIEFPFYGMQNGPLTTGIVAIGASLAAAGSFLFGKRKLKKKVAQQPKANHQYKEDAEKIRTALLAKFPREIIEKSMQENDAKRLFRPCDDANKDILMARQRISLFNRGWRPPQGHRDIDELPDKIIEEAIFQKNISLSDFAHEDIMQYLRNLMVVKGGEFETFEKLVIFAELPISQIALLFSEKEMLALENMRQQNGVEPLTATFGKRIFPMANKRKRLIEEGVARLPKPLTNLVLQYANNDQELPTL